MLDSANDAIDKEHLATAFMDLDERVDDWKSLKIESFGELLRFGTFTVIKGDNGKDSEREVCTLSITHCYEDFWPANLVYPARYGLHMTLDLAELASSRKGFFLQTKDTVGGGFLGPVKPIVDTGFAPVNCPQ